MKHLLLFIIPVFSPLGICAQETDTAFTAIIAAHRTHYKQEFLAEKRSPLTAKDTASLDFFPANPGWNIAATFTRTENAEPFDMSTYSGLTQRYVTYGTISFPVDSSIQTLSIYRNLQLSTIPAYKDYLFLPFKDATNTKTTYGGGRYIDLREGDIRDGKVTIDFNKVYNPWCAYSDGYNCPVPPRENHLKIGVEAGERLFLGEKKH